MAEPVHVIAKEGFKQGQQYDCYRPSYTDELVSVVVDRLHRKSQDGVKFQVLELGAGTGKFTRKLLAQLDESFRYLATDPSSDFLSVLKESSTGIDTAVCAAHDIPLPGNSIQNIIACQSFHWFANDVSVKEMLRVLIPGGRIMVFWSLRDSGNLPWLVAIECLCSVYNEAVPKPAMMEWYGVLKSFSNIKCLEQRNLDTVQYLKVDKSFMINYFHTLSYIVCLDDSHKIIFREKLTAILDKHFKDTEEITIPYKTIFYCGESHKNDIEVVKA